MNDSEPLSLVDTAWLRMDRPTNLMMICGMLEFTERVELNKLKEVIRARMLCFHRFRQRVITTGAVRRWKIDADFDLDWHVCHIALPDGSEHDPLEHVVGDLISTPLDPAKPMWQFHLIDNLTGGSVIVMRIHHCYGDGFALSHVISCMTDADPDNPGLDGEDIGPRSPQRSAWEKIFGPLAESIGDAVRISLSVADIGRDMLINRDHAAALAKTGADLAYQAAVIARMTPDSPTRFKGPLGVMKSVAWAKPLSLSEVKAVSTVLQCSINDVLVACVTGALRSFLLEQGGLDDTAEVRALVPVNLRPPGPVTSLGNHFGLVFLSLPIGVDDPILRVAAVQQRMTQLKHSQQPLVALGILAGMGLAPDFIKDRVLEALASNASAVITNVRGTDQARYLAGKRIARQMFWVPQSGGIGIGVSLLSYAGQISFGLVTDRRRVPDPEPIAQRFFTEFETLLLTALMMRWPADSAPGIDA